MSDASTPIADMLAECDAHGIRLLPADDGGLTIDAPHDALTPDLLDRLRAHKAELVALLQLTPNVPPTRSVTQVDVPANPECHCGATTWRDVPIHDGHSIRRDCGNCRRFIGFSVWYGKDTLHNEQ
jgi:hypothetical protein